jgi:hypothetical protein
MPIASSRGEAERAAVQSPDKFDLEINLKTAKALGIFTSRPPVSARHVLYA